MALSTPAPVPHLENDDVKLIKTDVIQSKWDPLARLIWATMGDEQVTEQEMVIARQSPLSPSDTDAFRIQTLKSMTNCSLHHAEAYQTWCDRSTHLRRIAWFVDLYESVDDDAYEAVMRQYPISLDFGLPGYCKMYVYDGNHRLAAAIYAKRPFVGASCGGANSLIKEATFTR